MKGKILIGLLLLFVCAANHYALAEQPIVREQGEPLFVSDSEPLYVEPTSVLDTLIGSDSIVVIHTVCAPICSSHARVYNKEWKEIGVLQPPFRSAFPEAYIEDGQIRWRDNDKFDYTPVL